MLNETSKLPQKQPQVEENPPLAHSREVELEEEVRRLRSYLAEAESELAAARKLAAICQQQIDFARERENQALEQMAAVRRSFSWKITAPLRSLTRFLPF